MMADTVEARAENGADPLAAHERRSVFSLAGLLSAIGALVCYSFSFYLLSLILRSLPVGIAYALWSGVGIIGISLIGWFFMNQKLDAAAMAGIALIIAGVLVINLFSQSGAH